MMVPIYTDTTKRSSTNNQYMSCSSKGNKNGFLQKIVVFINFVTRVVRQTPTAIIDDCSVEVKKDTKTQFSDCGLHCLLYNETTESPLPEKYNVHTYRFAQCCQTGTHRRRTATDSVKSSPSIERETDSAPAICPFFKSIANVSPLIYSMCLCNASPIVRDGVWMPTKIRSV